MMKKNQTNQPPSTARKDFLTTNPSSGTLLTPSHMPQHNLFSGATDFTHITPLKSPDSTPNLHEQPSSIRHIRPNNESGAIQFQTPHSQKISPCKQLASQFNQNILSQSQSPTNFSCKKLTNELIQQGKILQMKLKQSKLNVKISSAEFKELNTKHLIQLEKMQEEFIPAIAKIQKEIKQYMADQRGFNFKMQKQVCKERLNNTGFDQRARTSFATLARVESGFLGV